MDGVSWTREFINFAAKYSYQIQQLQAVARSSQMWVLPPLLELGGQ